MLLPETFPDPLVPDQVFHLWVPQCPVFTLVTSANTLGLPSWLCHRLSSLMAGAVSFLFLCPPSTV